MATKVQAEGLKVKEGRIELSAQHLDGEVTFIYPFAGPNTFAKVGEQINSQNLIRPTMAQTASLVYSAWQNPEEKYSAEIIKVLKSRWLWAFNGLLYTSKGVYIQDLPKTENGRVSLSLSELEKKLKQGDPSVRFVPNGYKTGEQSSSDLAKNPFVIDLAGKEGAEKLAEVSDKYKNKPYVYALTNVKGQESRVAALGGSWGFGGLDVVGGFGDFGSGHALGVSRSK